MPEPWEDPAEPPETDGGNLPLAGLLAELLASADVQPAGPPAEDESWMEAGAGSPAEVSGGGVPLEPEATLQALEGAGQQYREAGEPQPAANPLLARLLAEEPTAGESCCPDAAAASGKVAEEPGAALAGPPSPVAAKEETEPRAFSPGAFSAQQGAPAPPAEPTPPEAAGREPVSAIASTEEKQEPGFLSSPPAPTDTARTATSMPASDAAPPGAAAWLVCEPHPAPLPAGVDAQPQVPAPEPAWSAATAGVRMPPEGGADRLPELPASGFPAGTAPEEAKADASGTVEAEPARRLPEIAPAAAPVSAPIVSHASGGASEEDEFELVDAETAGKMLDRLLDAARSAIQSSLSPVLPAEPEARPAVPPEAGGKPAAGTPPAGGVADRSIPGDPEPVGTTGPAQTGVEHGAALPRQEGFGRTSERERRSRREESLQEASPLPPAAALLAMGLPERLRARLEQLGDVDRVLALRAAAAPEAAPVRQRRLLVFRVGAECYSLPMECVREVERVGKVTPAPGAPAFVRGLVNLRGEILPLLDLRLLLGADGAEPSASPRLVVAQASPEEPPLALMVDELNGLAPFGGGPSGEGGREEGLPPHVRGSIEHRGRRAWRLDAAAVFGLAALERLAEKA